VTVRTASDVFFAISYEKSFFSSTVKSHLLKAIFFEAVVGKIGWSLKSNQHKQI